MYTVTNHMGVSENSVPLNPMVLLIIIPMKNGYFIGNMPNIFRQTHMILFYVTNNMVPCFLRSASIIGRPPGRCHDELFGGHPKGFAA